MYIAGNQIINVPISVEHNVLCHLFKSILFNESTNILYLDTFLPVPRNLIVKYQRGRVAIHYFLAISKDQGVL